MSKLESSILYVDIYPEYALWSVEKIKPNNFVYIHANRTVGLPRGRWGRGERLPKHFLIEKYLNKEGCKKDKNIYMYIYQTS